MNCIIMELLDWDVLRTNLISEARTVRVFMHPIPEAKVGPSSRMVVPHGVIWVCDPKGGRGDVVIQEACA